MSSKVAAATHTFGSSSTARAIFAKETAKICERSSDDLRNTR